eukprot:TRINITY_DN1011_c0_g1_i3.p1 TRINITY_DN1011_c0_g1~~TRINITY_DN1011_c0_g1_i3.p1  ORF type:complete len:150 (-),score=36.92 TRINITY_DN1011_c0_g1_i3:735-1184(-)
MSKRKAEESIDQTSKKSTSDIVRGIKTAIKAKDGWQRKIRDQRILQNWLGEAKNQGVPEKLAQEVFRELLDEIPGPQTSSLLLGPKSEEEDEDDFAGADYSETVGGDCEGIVYADGLVPDSLRESLEKNLDAIAALPEKDFHPGSEACV